jgi:6-phosphogluconolactonase (cycloisomerase 2 family)
MMSRRTFSTLLASSVAAPSASWGQGVKAKAALYSGIGPQFTHFDVDPESMSLNKRAAVTLPGGTQYAWPHPSKKILYVTSSTGGPGQTGDQHHVSVFTVDPNGALTLMGQPLKLRQRPIHNSVDRSGEFLLIAYNDPSRLSVHKINGDGSIGEEIKQPDGLDYGIYAHQILATPSNQSIIVVTRGNDPAGGKAEDPGSLKVYGFKNGVLSNKAAVQPGNGLGFGPRHIDFHPTQPWVFVSVERQNQLYVYKLLPDGGLSPEPLFVKSTVVDRSKKVSTAGPIHVHPNGRFVYLGNRGGTNAPADAEKYEGWPVFDRTSSNIAAFSINQETGEPTLMQSADIHGAHPRTFSIDPSARILVAGSLLPVAVRDAGKVTLLPSGLTVFRIGEDGKLEFVRKYDLETSRTTQWWTGMVRLA